MKYLAICSKTLLGEILIGGSEYRMKENPCLQQKWLDKQCTFNLVATFAKLSN